MKGTSRVALTFLKDEIEKLESMRNDLQQSNRMQQSLLLTRESEICNRRHQISALELGTTSLREHSAMIERNYLIAETRVSSLEAQLRVVKNSLEEVLWEYDSLNSACLSLRPPDIKSLAKRVQERRENARQIRKHLRKLPRVIELIDAEKQDLEAQLNTKRDKLEILDKQVSGLELILRTPIDDLQLEQLAVDALENTALRDLPNRADESEASFNEELSELEILEEENRRRRENVKPSFIAPKMPLSPLMSRMRRHPATPSAKRPMKGDFNFAMSQISENIDKFEQRQASIDRTERDTLMLRQSYAEDQQQIENSWSYKMDDIRALQSQLDESENLMLEIDEMKDKILDLHEEYDDVHSKFVKRSHIREVTVSRLDALAEIHPDLVSRVEKLVERKKELGIRDRAIRTKRRTIEKLKVETEDLQNQLRLREQLVNELERERDSIRRNESGTSMGSITPVKEPSGFARVPLSGKAKYMNKTPMKRRASDDSLTDQCIELENSMRPVKLDFDSDDTSVVRITSENDEDMQRKQILFAAFPSPDNFISDTSETDEPVPETPKRFMRTEYNSFIGNETAIPQRSPARISFAPLSPVRRGTPLKRRGNRELDSLEEIINEYSEEETSAHSVDIPDSIEVTISEDSESGDAGDNEEDATDSFESIINDDSNEEEDLQGLFERAEMALEMPLRQSKFHTYL